MTKKQADITVATSSVVKILQGLEVDDQKRVLSATMILLGQNPVVNMLPAQTNMPERLTSASTVDGPQAYFEQKQPRTKMEEIAVAARYRERNEGAESSTAGEIQQVFKDARRNFDRRNFRRDLDNAKVKGWFVRSTGRDSVQLSYAGQQFVDALPERTTARVRTHSKKVRSAKKSTR